MNEQDRQAIEGLFTRLGDAERQAGPKDAEAEAFIRQQIERQPGAPYLMAQTIVMQNFALEQAQQRIAQLEEEIETRPAANSGGFLGGLFGGGQPAQSPRSTSVPATGQPRGFPQAGAGMQPGGYPAGGPMQQPQQGGGFLAGAAQTAMGVAGGVLLANAVGSMFGGGAASAATPAPDAAAAAPAEPAPTPEPQPEPVSADDNDSGGGFFDDMFGGDMDI